MTYKKKLIEVSLPLPEVNDASAYDKMPGIGPHPKGIHHWWARLPLPTARAVLFASVVDDPSEHPERFPTEAEQNAERERLFNIVRSMMQKKLHEHPEVYATARAEMLASCEGALPSVFDPFSGGGSIPLEARRLGFKTYAADLNPVAVLLNKCNLEILPQWAGHPAVNPKGQALIGGSGQFAGAQGLAADVRYYGGLIRERARAKIAHLYPNVRLPKDFGGGQADVIAWIWARTVASPDPAARGAHVPLMSTFWLSNKKGSEAWLEPVVDKARGAWHFVVRTGVPQVRSAIKAGTKTGRAQFRCLLTDAPIRDEHIKAEGLAGRMGTALVAVVADGKRRRVFLPVASSESVVSTKYPDDAPHEQLVYDSRYLTPPGYGMKTVDRLFMPRQLTALVTLSDLVRAIGADIRRDAGAAGFTKDDADSYSQAVTIFLALAVDRCADFNNALCRWSPSNQKVMNLFARQAIPMVWDFAEANILANSVGGWSTCSEYVADCIEVTMPRKELAGDACQTDAATGANELRDLLVSTDPPYYDNVPYADISDFFYVWLRRTIGDLYPGLFSTVLTPKVPELTASPGRFEGDKEKAKHHFESGFNRAFSSLRERLDLRCPLTVYYAFKQSDEEIAGEEDAEERNVGVDLTTGWETLLEALIASGFQITATWPVRASQAWRMRAMGSNALASYIVLACRPRAADAPQSGRREFLAQLRKELPGALRHLQQGNIAPVDFAQAAIGPGMAVYSQYSHILEVSGSPMSVRAALGLINQIKDEILGEPEADYDPYTRWAISWYDQHGFDAGEFGDANTLANAHAIAVGLLRDAGVVRSGAGEVCLLKPEDLDKDWSPEEKMRPPIWRMAHQLVRCYFVDKRGDLETAALLRKLGPAGESARDLAYRLFSIAERRKRSQDALAYNAMVLGWPEIARLAQSAPTTLKQADLL